MGTPSTFYIGPDGILKPAEEVSLIGGTEGKVWYPKSPEARTEAKGILDQMGRLDLKDPNRKALTAKLKEVVAKDGLPAVTPSTAATGTPEFYKAEAAKLPGDVRYVGDMGGRPMFQDEGGAGSFMKAPEETIPEALARARSRYETPKPAEPVSPVPPVPAETPSVDRIAEIDQELTALDAKYKDFLAKPDNARPPAIKKGILDGIAKQMDALDAEKAKLSTGIPQAEPPAEVPPPKGKAVPLKDRIGPVSRHIIGKTGKRKLWISKEDWEGQNIVQNGLKQYFTYFPGNKEKYIKADVMFGEISQTTEIPITSLSELTERLMLEKDRQRQGIAQTGSSLDAEIEAEGLKAVEKAARETVPESEIALGDSFRIDGEKFKAVKYEEGRLVIKDGQEHRLIPGESIRIDGGKEGITYEGIPKQAEEAPVATKIQELEAEMERIRNSIPGVKTEAERKKINDQVAKLIDKREGLLRQQDLIKDKSFKLAEEPVPEGPSFGEFRPEAAGATVEDYIGKIRNVEKKRYASDYYKGETEGKEYDLSVMGRQAVRMNIDELGGPKGEPFKLDTEESPTAEAPLKPEAAGEQDELFPGERSKYREKEKPPPAPPPEGGLFAKGGGEEGFAPEKDFRKKPGAPIDTDKPMSRSGIAKFLSEKFDIPLRVGRFRSALGIFKVGPEVIRTRFANDIEVIAHEIGHALHKYLWPEARTSGGGLAAGPLRAFQDELLPIATKPRAGGSKNAEGFAEFIRRYVVDPDEAKRVAPKFYKFFEEELDKKSPDSKAILLEARRQYKVYFDQPG